MKVMVALWSPAKKLLLGEVMRSALREAGTTRLQVNLDDMHIPDSVLRLQTFDTPVTGVVSLWTEGHPAAAIAAVVPAAEHLAAWQVEERVALAPPEAPSGRRAEGLAQVAFLRRPAELTYEVWRNHWQGPHTQIAMETQATFGYTQNRVIDALTEDTPRVDAIVEELFPDAAMRDIHAFYGSNGDQAELDRRMTRLMQSVATMGADRDLDLVPTSRYVFELSP